MILPGISGMLAQRALKKMRTQELTYAVIALGAACWCAAILLAPVLATGGGALAPAGNMLYMFFQPICHQLDARSFHLRGAPCAVCVRCSAIYVAFLAGTLLYPALRPLRSPSLPPRWVLLASLTPMLLDVAAGMTGLHEVTNASRAITGSLAGCALPFFIIPAAIEAAEQILLRVPSSTRTLLRKG